MSLEFTSPGTCPVTCYFSIAIGEGAKAGVAMNRSLLRRDGLGD